MSEQIDRFFKSESYAVVGASNNTQKFGNKILRCYMQHGKKVIPVNPYNSYIEDLAVVHDILDLPPKVKSISIVTPPLETEKIVEKAIAKGIENIWMQPGSESDKAILRCLENKINVIAKGPCILLEIK